MARVAGRAWNPDAAAFAAGRFADQAALVLAGNRRGMHLNKLAISIANAGLIAASRRAAGADDGHGGFAKNQPVPASGHDHRIATERADLHRAHVLGDDADALRAGASVVYYWPEEFPELIL